MMPRSMHKVVGVYCTVPYENLDRHLSPRGMGTLCFCGEQDENDSFLWWARRNRLEYVDFYAAYDKLKERAENLRDDDMVNFCDHILIICGESDLPHLHILDYCLSLGRSYEVHLVDNLS